MLRSFILLILATLASQGIYAQYKPKPKATGSAVNTDQWWVGVGGGINFSSVEVLSQYHVLVPAGTQAAVQKDYQNYNLPGSQFNLMISYGWKNLMAVWQPGIIHHGFTYENRFEWISQENPENNLYIDNQHQQNLTYLEMPLKIRYLFNSGKSISPFLQAGGFYSRLLQADKNIESQGEDNASGSANPLPLDTQSNDITGLLQKDNYGLMAGAGIIFPISDGMLIIEVNYRQGFRNLVDSEQRYYVDKFVTGAYDVPDDWILNNIAMNISFAIPLKFITSKDFIPVNR